LSQVDTPDSLIIANGSVIGRNRTSDRKGEAGFEGTKKATLPEQWLIYQGVNMAQPA